jgi:hypothetical protein
MNAGYGFVGTSNEIDSDGCWKNNRGSQRVVPKTSARFGSAL